MLKKTAVLILTCLSMCYSIHSDSSFITYEFLGNVAAESSYTDHIPHWRRLFRSMKVRGFIECGCGFSTGYFLDNAEMVVSIEYLNPGYGDKWFQDCLNIFADRKNWIPLTYNESLRSNSFNNACAYQCCMHKDYALIDPSYLDDLNDHFKNLIDSAKTGGFDIDVAFVDPGIYIRGDLVKLLLANKIPVVAAHDTGSDKGTKVKKCLYGWNKVATPLDYIKIYIPTGQGTTFWINKNYPSVIVSILGYRDAILQQQEAGVTLQFADLTQLADAP